MKTIMCFGDSNTYGADPLTGGRYPKEDRWTTKLQALLGSEYEVIPEGLCGRTTAYDRENNVDWKNGAKVLLSSFGTQAPVDQIIFMLGTNDVSLFLGLSEFDIANGMEKLVKMVIDNIEEIQTFVPEMMIVVPCAINANYPNSIFADRLNEESVRKSKAIAPLYKEIAEKYGCKFLDVSQTIEFSDIDSMHMTKEGHTKLAKMIYDCLVK